MFRKRPKNPLQRDLSNIILWAFLFVVALLVENWKIAIVFFLFMVYYIWHKKHTAKKISDALEKREQNYADIYGYEEGYGDNVSFEDNED